MFRFVFYLLSSKVIIAFLTIISAAIINRTLGPAKRGDLAELTMLVAVFASLFGLSASTSMFHYSNRREYQFTRGELAGSTLALWCLLNLLVVVGVVGSLVLFPRYFSSNFNNNLGILLFFIFSNMGLNYSVTLIQIDNYFKYLSAVNVIFSVVTLIGVIFLALYNHLTVIAIIWLTCLIQFATISSFLLYSGAKSLNWSNLKINWSLTSKMIKSSLKVHIATVSTLLYVKFDQLMVYNMAGNKEAGYYSMAANVGLYLMIVPMTVQQVLYPKVISDSDTEDAYTTIRVTKFTILIFAICLIVFFLFAQTFIKIYAGNKFLPAVRMLRTLLIGVWFFTIPNLLSPYWVKKGYFLLASCTAVSLLAFNLLLNYIWIPRYGGLGAAWATNVSYFVGMITSMFVFYYISRKNPLNMFRYTADDMLTLLKKLKIIPLR